MNINTVKLKVKVKHLAAEARIIRREANKLSGLDKHSLNQHRTTTVRREARATQLVYGYLRGTPYRSMEATCDYTVFAQYTRPRMDAMLKKYGTCAERVGLDAWLLGAVVAQEAAG